MKGTGSDWAAGVPIDLSKVLNPGNEEPLARGVANPKPDGNGSFKDVKVIIPSTVSSGTVLDFSVVAGNGGSVANAWFTVTDGQSSQPTRPDQPSQVKPNNGNNRQESFEQQAIEQIKTNTECMLSLQQAKNFSRFDPNLFQEIADTVNDCIGAFQGSARLLTPGQVE